MNSFYHQYNNKIRRDLFLRNVNIHPYEIPTLNKIVISAGISQNLFSKKQLLLYGLAFELISGQKPSLTRSKKSIAAFKIRQNEPLGYKVSLRKRNMFNFLNIYINLVLPRLRDYQGFTLKKNKIEPNLTKKKFQSFSFSCKELLLFPQLEQHYVLFQSLLGCNITLIISTKEIYLIKSLLTSFKIPIL
jgi:large subunit ribosomal protein L5